MISNRLFRNVIGKEYAQIDSIDNSNVRYSYIEGGYVKKCINIYELANMCKEWAWDNGYEIESTYSGDIRISRASDSTIVKSYFGLDEIQEPKAIIMACEWILEQEKQDGSMEEV